MGILASLIGGFISGEALDMARRAKTTALIYLIAGVLALIGLGFLVGAGYIAAARQYGSFEAALGFGLGFLAAAGLILLARTLARSPRRLRRHRRKADLATIAGTAAVTALPFLLRSKAGVLAPLIAVAAYMIYRESRTTRDGPAHDD